jgi:hypothetical protein
LCAPFSGANTVVVSEAAANKGGPGGAEGLAANIKHGRHQTQNTEHGKEREKKPKGERDDARDVHYKNYKANAAHGVGHAMGVPSRKTKKTGFENWQEEAGARDAAPDDPDALVLQAGLRRQRSLSLEGTAFTANVGGKSFAKYTNLGINHGLGASLQNVGAHDPSHNEDEDGFFTLARKKSFADPARKKDTIDQIRNILESHTGEGHVILFSSLRMSYYREILVQ